MFIVQYEVIKQETNVRPIYECWCDGRLQAKVCHGGAQTGRMGPIFDVGWWVQELFSQQMLYIHSGGLCAMTVPFEEGYRQIEKGRKRTFYREVR